MGDAFEELFGPRGCKTNRILVTTDWVDDQQDESEFEFNTITLVEAMANCTTTADTW